MTINDLEQIISSLPDNTVLLIEETDLDDVETVHVQYHSDGRIHLIFSTLP